MQKLKLALLIALLAIPFAVFAAPTVSFQNSILPNFTDRYDLGSSTPALEWNGLYVKTICLSGDCKAAWPTGGGGGGGSGLATSTADYIVSTQNGIVSALKTSTAANISQNASADVVLNAIVADASSLGTSIYVKAGTYYLNATTTFPGTSDLNGSSWTLTGNGQGSTNFVVNNSADAFTFGASTKPLFRGFTVYLANGANAITASSTNTGYRSIWNGDFEDIAVTGTTSVSTGWGFNLVNDDHNVYKNIYMTNIGNCWGSFTDNQNHFNPGDSNLINMWCSMKAPSGTSVTQNTAVHGRGYVFDGSAAATTLVNQDTLSNVGFYEPFGTSTGFYLNHTKNINGTIESEGAATSTELYKSSFNNLQYEYIIGTSTTAAYISTDASSQNNTFSMTYIDSYAGTQLLFNDLNTSTNLPNILQGVNGGLATLNGAGTFSFATTSASIVRRIQGGSLGNNYNQVYDAGLLFKAPIVDAANSLISGTTSAPALFTGNLYLEGNNSTAFTPSAFTTLRGVIANTNQTNNNFADIDFDMYKPSNNTLVTGTRLMSIFNHTLSTADFAVVNGTKEVGRFTSGGNFTVGTTTAFWQLTAASTTGPQIGLSDGNAADFAWTARSINNNLYFATSTATATSTSAAFLIDSNAQITIPTLGGTTGCVQASATGLLTNTGTACGSGSSGGDPFTHPSATVSATTTEIDFNGGMLSSASSTFTATTSFSGVVVKPVLSTSASVSVGGAFNLTNTLNDGAGMILFTNHAANALGRLFSVDCGNSAFDQACVNIQNNGTQTTLNVMGGSPGLGIIKVSGLSGAASNNSSAAISVDSSANSYMGQGIFAKCNSSTTTPCLVLRDSSSNLMFSVDGNKLTTFINASSTMQTISSSVWLTGLTGPAELAIDSTGKVYAAATTTAANPTASIGLSTINGTAATYMRSDAAPALDQTIAPTMTGAWAFNNAASTTIANGFYANTIAAGYFMATSSTATSTFAGGLNVLEINETGNATSTFANGINVSGGCFSIAGVCVGGGGGSTNAGGTNGQMQYNNGGTAFGGIANSFFSNTGGWTSFGTSSPAFGLLTLGTSTAPQLLLSDNNAGDSMWALRNLNGDFDLATSTATATSTVTAFSIASTTGLATFANGITNRNGNIIETNGQFIASDGTLNKPTFSFSSDNTTGIYLSSSGVLGFVASQNTCSMDGNAGNFNCGLNIRTANGSANTPSFTFINDTNTGISDPLHDDNLLFSTNAIERARFDANGLFLDKFNASTTQLSVFNQAYFGANATSTFSKTGQLLMGTTTSYWNLAVASSTGPQFSLLDGNAADFAWTQRAINNNFYLATSTATATSTLAAFSIMSSGLNSAGQVLIGPQYQFGIGTSTPWAALSIIDSTGLRPLFALATSTSGTASSTEPIFMVDSNYHNVTGGGQPTVTALSCGTAPGVNGNDNVMLITTGSSGQTTCNITFAKAWLNIAPICVPVNYGTSQSAATTISASTTLTKLNIVFGASVTSAKIGVICTGFQ